MIPLQIQLKNFMSYRSPVTVNFRGIRTACLAGENGAGKSALLEAMTWAVWGRSRAPNSRDVVTLGESQVEVTLDFQLGDRDYRVFRRQTVGTRVSTTLEFYVRPADAEEDDWHTITADSVRETDRKIVATLKMDYETFVNSAFLMQGQADTFTQKRPGDRKKVLADILNLGDYDILSGMARDEERALRGRANNLSNQMSQIEGRLATRPEVESELETLSAALIEASTSVESLEADIRLLQEALSAMSALIRARKATSERLARQQMRLNELTQRSESDRKDIEPLSKLIERGAAIERDYEELIEWRAAHEKQSAILNQRQPLEVKLRDVERSIDQARSRHERKIDQIRSNVKQAEETLAGLARGESELANLRKEIESAGDPGQGIETQRKNIRALEAEKTTLEAECKALRASMNEIKANMELLERGDAECPVCRRPMRDGEHENVAELWSAEGKQLGIVYREHGVRIKEITRELPALTGKLQEMEVRRTAVAEKRAIVGRLESEVKSRPLVETDTAAMRLELEKLRGQLAQGSYAADLPREAVQLQRQLAELAYDSELANSATRSMRKLAGAEQDHMELQTARVRHENLQASLAAREAAIVEAETDITALQSELEETARQLTDEPDMRKKLTELSDTLDKARSQRDGIQARFGAVSNQIAELDRLAEELTKLREELGTVGIEADAYRELALAFGRNGIQAMIVETILPELEDEANRLLARMTTSHLHIRFRSTRQALSNDNIIETLDIVIRDETGERPYALYSGGEAFRVDFAIRVALSKLLVRRAGTTIDLLIIDEGFGSQDVRGRDGLIEALQSVESDFATILVITHIDAVRDMFPARIEITKTDAGSSVSVI